MSKVAQYAIDDNKVYARFSKVNLKEAQDLHCKRPLLRQKKSIRGDKMKESYIVVGLFTKMLKSPMKMTFTFQVILFLETLEYQKFHLLRMTTSYLFIF